MRIEGFYFPHKWHSMVGARKATRPISAPVSGWYQARPLISLSATARTLASLATETARGSSLTALTGKPGCGNATHEGRFRRALTAPRGIVGPVAESVERQLRTQAAGMD